jgi:hypothetical protein
MRALWNKKQTFHKKYIPIISGLLKICYGMATDNRVITKLGHKIGYSL